MRSGKLLRSGAVVAWAALLFVVGTAMSGCGSYIPRLVRDLRKGDVLRRRRAALTLYRQVPLAYWSTHRRDAERAAVALGEALGDEDLSVRFWSVIALQKLAGVRAITPLTLRPLTQGLKDEDYSVRREAAGILCSLGPKAEPVVRILSEFVRGDNPEAAFLAAKVLGSIGPRARTAIPALNKALTNPKSVIRLVCASAVALHKLNAPPADQKRAVQILIMLLKDREGLPGYAADSLGEIGPRARAGVPALVEALKTGDESLRRDAARGLGKIGPEARAAVPALLDALESDDTSLRGDAARALAEIAPAEAEVVRALAELARRGNCEAIEALARIGAPAKGAVAAIFEALKGKSGHVRMNAAQALAEIGPEASHVPLLVEALKDDERMVRYFIAIALGRIGPDARAAVPALIASLKGSDVGVRWVSAEALGNIGDESALPALTEALKDDNRPVRDRAAKAIRKIRERQRTREQRA